MLRLKRQYRQLGTRLVVGGCLAILLYCCTLHLPAQSRVRQAVLTTENYTWTRLSDDVYLLSAYFDVRETGVHWKTVLVLAIFNHSALDLIDLY